jgi:hypothetical protein
MAKKFFYMVTFVLILNTFVTTSKLSRIIHSFDDSNEIDDLNRNEQDTENDIDKKIEEIRKSLNLALSKYSRSSPYEGKNVDKNANKGYDKLMSNTYHNVKFGAYNRFRL